MRTDLRPRLIMDVIDVDRIDNVERSPSPLQDSASRPPFSKVPMEIATSPCRRQLNSHFS
jgi:hypothetical protein